MMNKVATIIYENNPHLKPAKKILHLTLKKKWFDLIASGKKTQEYRENKPYWQNRLTGKTFDEVHFRNGYSKDAPFMRVKCGDIYLNCLSARDGGSIFVIELGDILEVQNVESKNS